MFESIGHKNGIMSLIQYPLSQVLFLLPLLDHDLLASLGYDSLPCLQGEYPNFLRFATDGCASFPPSRGFEIKHCGQSRPTGCWLSIYEVIG